MNAKRTDVAIVGRAFLGLAHAYLASTRSGPKVAVFDGDRAAIGASVHNFGMIGPIGLPAGQLHEMALRRREMWIEVLQRAELSFSLTGSLDVAYRDDEAAVSRMDGHIGALLLPAAAESAVKLHETLILVASGLRQGEFRRKERPLPVQDFEISRCTACVTHVGQADGLLQVCDRNILT